MHTPPPNILQFHKLQPLDALDSDRWRLLDPMSGSYFSVPDQASIHLWPFESTSNLNGTKFMVVGWGTDRNRVPVIQAWGINDLAKAMAYLGKMVQRAMNLPDGDQFHYDKSRSCPWVRFVEDALIADASGATMFEAPLTNPAQRTRYQPGAHHVFTRAFPSRLTQSRAGSGPRPEARYERRMG